MCKMLGCLEKEVRGMCVICAGGAGSCVVPAVLECAQPGAPRLCSWLQPSGVKAASQYWAFSIFLR